MNTLSFEQETLDGGNLCLRVGGSLDRSAAYELRDQIVRLKTQRLVLDFSKLGAVDDMALAILGMWLADRQQKNLRVELLGLTPHACNVLQVFGVAAPAQPA